LKVDKDFVRKHGGFSIRSPKTAKNINGRPMVKERIQAYERVEGINMSSKPETAGSIGYGAEPSVNSNYSNVIAQIGKKR
jgi:hypothetical protein